MTLKTYSCDSCETEIVRDISMNAPVEQQRALIEFCERCCSEQRFGRVYLPIAVSFGMLTKRYTGQQAAVSGWGTHNLDYGKSGSDLVTGRAQEAANRIEPAVVD